MEAKISVVMPVYNSEQYLDQCIQSVLNQTFVDFELIIVDDGSRDNSIPIILSYLNDDPRIKLIKQANSGQSAARRNGILRANGHYITFIDSDDFVDTNWLKVMYQNAVESNADIVNMNFINFFQTGNYESTHMFDEKKRLLNRKQALTEWMLDRSVRGFLWTKLYSTEFFKTYYQKVGDSFLEDSFLNLILFNNLGKMLVDNTALYHYRIRQDSSIRSRYTDEKLNAVNQIIAYLNTVVNDAEMDELKMSRILQLQYIVIQSMSFMDIYRHKVLLHEFHANVIKLKIKIPQLNYLDQTICRFINFAVTTWICLRVRDGVYRIFNKLREIKSRISVKGSVVR